MTDFSGSDQDVADLDAPYAGRKKTKRFWIGTCAITVAAAIGAAFAGYKTFLHEPQRFVEGKQYKTLDEFYPAKQGQLDNYYWLSCDSCYMFEDVLAKWSKDNPAVSVNKIHATSNDLWLDDAKLDTTLRAIGKASLIDPLFKISVERKGFTHNKNLINQFLSENKVDLQAFWSEYNSPASMASAIERASNSAKVNVKVVPTFVLDGKYKIFLGGLKSKEELIDLLNYLETNQPSKKDDG
ncbi:hypothetical protein ACI2KR_06985 [Pseudomonas luteola]